MNIPTYNHVHLKRGSRVKKKIPTDSLILRIEKKDLLPTDQISVDGKTWVRLDKHKQLEYLFNEKENSPHTTTNKKKTTNPKNNTNTEDITSTWAIHIAFVFAINSSFFTLLFLAPQNPEYFFDVLLSCTLAIGIYKKHLKSAIAMLCYFLISKGIQFYGAQSYETQELYISLMVLYGYALGVIEMYRVQRKKSIFNISWIQNISPINST